MGWDSATGRFTPGGTGSGLPGQASGGAGNQGVTVQDLINLGLIDPGVVSGGGALQHPNALKLTDAVSVALSKGEASVEMSSTNLFRKMNGLAGVVVGSNGIAGYNSAGATTFAIDAATGDVTLVGTITASAGIIGGFSIGDGYLRDSTNSFGMVSTVTANYVTVVDYTLIDAGVDTITITLNGTAYVGTEGTNDATHWDAATSNTQTAANIATWANLQTGINAWSSGAICYISANDPTDTAVVTTSMAAGEGTVTAGTAVSDVRFWAGSTYALRNTAPMRIYEDGAAVFSNITVTGGNINTTGYVYASGAGATVQSSSWTIAAVQTTNGVGGVIGDVTGTNTVGVGGYASQSSSFGGSFANTGGGFAAQFLHPVRNDSFLEFTEMTAPTGLANSGRVYTQDNGAGKTQLMVIFSSGAAQQIAIQP